MNLLLFFNKTKNKPQVEWYLFCVSVCISTYSRGELYTLQHVFIDRSSVNRSTCLYPQMCNLKLTIFLKHRRRHCYLTQIKVYVVSLIYKIPYYEVSVSDKGMKLLSGAARHQH